jgi:hypothetical protein
VHQGLGQAADARGGVEAHTVEVLTTAALTGLRVLERPLPQRGVRGLVQALAGLQTVDVVSLTSPSDAESSRLVLHSSDAVLANSGHEPFGLVGLETVEPREFIGLFGDLRANAALERALRQDTLRCHGRGSKSGRAETARLSRLRSMTGGPPDGG